MKHSLILTAALFLGQFFFTPQLAAPAAKTETYVYICTGGSSVRYHKTDKCRGLENCQASVKKVTLDYAENKLKRSQCKLCYKRK